MILLMAYTLTVGIKTGGKDYEGTVGSMFLKSATEQLLSMLFIKFLQSQND